MALNTYFGDDENGNDAIVNHLTELVNNINKQGFNIEFGDIDYELLCRCEYIGIKSSVLYPDEDLPAKFGVYRGYNGGGIHSSLVKTEIYNLPKNKQKKAEKLLAYFETAFWSILKELDAENEKLCECASWDSLTL
jgi:hypothetical protein